MNAFFKDKVTIVTGGSSGIGLETAKMLVQKGARVVLAARNMEKLQSASKELGGVSCFQTDVTENLSVRRLVNETIQKFGRIDILINNAGLLVYKPMQDCSDEEFKQVMEVNYFGAVQCVNAVLPMMKKQKSGWISNVSSIAGRIGFPSLGYYCASKFALAGYTETLRQEVRESGIRVSLICPGTVYTPMTQNIIDRAKEKGKNIFPIRPQTVAKTILRAIEEEKAEIFVPAATRLLYQLHFFFPQFTEWLAWKFRAADPENFSG